MKTLKKIYLLFAVSVIALMLSSCTEDPVTPQTGNITFDSARFDWTVYYVDRIDYVSMWCPDSSNVYMVNDDLDMMTHLRDGVRRDYMFSGFVPYYITGLTNNEIYVMGRDLQAGNYPAKLKRFDGAVFTDIDINIPENNYIRLYRYRGYTKSPGEIWFSTNKFLLKYDGNSFVSYPTTDTTVYVYSIFNTPENKLQYIGIHNWFPDIYIDTDLFEFQNNTWNRIFTQTLDTTKNVVGLLEFGGNKYGYNYIEGNCLYSFSNNSFAEMNCIMPYYFETGRTISGKSYNEYSAVIVGFAGPRPFYICNWNGLRWSREYWFAGADIIRHLTECVDNNLYFFLTGNVSEARTYVYRGIRKMQ